uniref:Uncharacterized protein n=1 Tax=Strombidium rassoulzadegani TaxID=1082188 RepID=A0A7S3CQ03_9SPIT|mmetsp:Transcript_2795/g.4779  ORF Transcript_2795/g.4779 Transcript_2795/m.4779 type:complete len:158 (+) Transcript_2795:267-740(+)
MSVTRSSNFNHNTHGLSSSLGLNQLASKIYHAQLSPYTGAINPKNKRGSQLQRNTRAVPESRDMLMEQFEKEIRDNQALVHTIRANKKAPQHPVHKSEFNQYKTFTQSFFVGAAEPQLENLTVKNVNRNQQTIDFQQNQAAAQAMTTAFDSTLSNQV